MRSQLSTVGLNAHAIGALFRKSFLVPVSQGRFSTSSSLRLCKIGKGETPQNSFHEVSITLKLKPDLDQIFKKRKNHSLISLININVKILNKYMQTKFYNT